MADIAEAQAAAAVRIHDLRAGKPVIADAEGRILLWRRVKRDQPAVLLLIGLPGKADILPEILIRKVLPIRTAAIIQMPEVSVVIGFHLIGRVLCRKGDHPFSFIKNNAHVDSSLL